MVKCGPRKFFLIENYYYKETVMTLKFEDRDEYLRRSIAEKIIKLIDAPVNVSPMVIDGSWGTGKTEFSKKLCSLISDNGNDKKVIYIDAFKEDHCEDPLLTITAAIAKELPEKQKEALIEKMVPAVKFGLKTFLKAGTGWILKQDADVLAEDFHGAVREVSNAAIDGTIENIIKEHMNAENNINALKDKLAELARIQKIVLVIDELDRCRPSFSVMLLEKVKHIFDIENVTTILVTNLEQLKSAINHTYGSTIDSQNYLDKFIKYTIALPNYFKPDGYTTRHTATTHWQILANSDESLTKFNDEYFRQINELLSIRSLSLREVETLFRYFQIYQSLTNNIFSRNRTYVFSLTIMIGIYLYCFGDRRLLSDLSSKASLISASKTLGIDKFEVDLENIYKTSHIHLMFYTILKESKHDFESMLPSNQQEKEAFKEHALALTKGDYTMHDFTRPVKDAFDTLSLI